MLAADWIRGTAEASELHDYIYAHLQTCPAPRHERPMLRCTRRRVRQERPSLRRRVPGEPSSLALRASPEE